MPNEPKVSTSESASSLLSDISTIITDVLSSPLHITLVAICLILIYKIYRLNTAAPVQVAPPPKRKRFKRRNLTLAQLREFDGVKSEFILIAINGNIYDVSCRASMYGPDGPYGVLAGRDASRALATFQLDQVKDDYDDISDLNGSQMDQMNEWVLQFQSKYDCVGKLIKPGEPEEVLGDSEDEDEMATGANAVTRRKATE